MKKQIATHMNDVSSIFLISSFDEMGQYDIPAAIAYAQKQHSKNFNAPKDQKLVYVGHSMGTTMFWVSFDANAEFMSQSVALMVGMGPVATVSHMYSPIRYLAPYTKDVQVNLCIKSQIQSIAGAAGRMARNSFFTTASAKPLEATWLS